MMQNWYHIENGWQRALLSGSWGGHNGDVGRQRGVFLSYGRRTWDSGGREQKFSPMEVWRLQKDTMLHDFMEIPLCDQSSNVNNTISDDPAVVCQCHFQILSSWWSELIADRIPDVIEDESLSPVLKSKGIPGLRPWGCGDCPKALACKQSWESHRKMFHPESTTPYRLITQTTEVTISSVKWGCGDCPKALSSKHSWEYHRKTFHPRSGKPYRLIPTLYVHTTFKSHLKDDLKLIPNNGMSDAIEDQSISSASETDEITKDITSTSANGPLYWGCGDCGKRFAGKQMWKIHR